MRIRRRIDVFATDVDKKDYNIINTAIDDNDDNDNNNNNNNNGGEKEEEEDNNTKNKKRKLENYRMPYKKLPMQNSSLPGWLEAHLRLKGTRPVSICDKKLTSSDTCAQQNRLLFSYASINHTLLPMLKQCERDELTMERNSIMAGGISVLTLDRMGRKWSTSLKLWSSGNYALKGQWRKLVMENQLVANRDTVCVLAFRHGQDREYLGFVVLVL